MAPCLLIVDPDEEIRRILAYVFSQEGIAVETAASGQEAIERAQTCAVPLLLTDARLPDMPVATLLQTMRTLHPGIAFVVAVDATDDANMGSAVSPNQEDVTFIPRPFNLEQLVGMVHEVLDKRQLRREVARMVSVCQEVRAESRHLEGEVRRYLAQLEAMRRVALKITAHLDLDVLLRFIVTEAVELMEGSGGGIYLWRPEQEVLEWVTSVEGSEIPLGSLLRPGEGMAGKVWQTKKPLAVEQYMMWDGRASQYEGLHDVSVIGVPIQYGDQCVGVLDVEAPVGRLFSSMDIEALSLFATQAAIAIHNARLFRETEQALAETEALYRTSRAIGEADSVEAALQALAKGIELSGWAMCGLTLISATDEAGCPTTTNVYTISCLETGQWSPVEVFEAVPVVDRGLTRRLLESPDGELLSPGSVDFGSLFSRLADEYFRDLSSVWVTGLVSHGRPMGFLSLGSARPPDEVSSKELRRLRNYADQITVVLENQALLSSVRQEMAQWELLHRLGRHTSESLSVGEVARRALDDICGFMGAMRGIVLMHEPESHRLRVAAVSDETPELFAQVLEEIDLYVGDGLIGWVAAERQAVIVHDVEHDPRWLPLPDLDDWVRSVLCVPLISGDDLVGAMSVYSERKAYFTEEHLRLVEIAAATVAAALANARLYETERRQRREAETLRQVSLALTSALKRDEVVELILAQLQEVVPYDTASVQLFHDDQMEIVGGRGFPNLSEIVGLTFPRGGDNPNDYVIRTRKPLIVADAPRVYREFRRSPHAQVGIRSWLGVPMSVGERLIGMIALDKKESGFYTPAHARLAEAFAAQAAVAIENARLFESEQEQRRLNEALAQAVAAISSTLDIEEVFDQILEQVERVVPGDTFNVMLIEDDVVRVVRRRGYNHLEASHRAPPEGDTIPVNRYPLLDKMRASGEPVVISDTASSPDWVRTREADWRVSYVGAPIRIQNQVVGFLNVNGFRVGQFDLSDAHRLQMFADHAALAIENARLYRQQREYSEQLELRVQERTAELRHRNAWLEAILDSTTDGILVVGHHDEIILSNPVAENWLHQSLSPPDAQRLREAINEMVRQARSGEESPRTIVELTGLDLELVPASILETGPKSLVVLAIHDVSHLRMLDRMKTRFVSNVSHELRTPVTTIKLYAELMKRSPLEKWPEYLDVLIQEADRQADLVEDILYVSRIDAGRLAMEARPVGIDELANAAVLSHQLLAANQGVDLEVKLSSAEGMTSSSPVVLVDPGQMMQVINNLVENGIRYTPAGGRVVVSTMTAGAEGRVWAVIEVADTGWGIPEEELPHIFERFFRGEEPRQMQISGTGLGLAIVREVVELHGGRVTVDSRWGEGSTFRVWLPLAETSGLEMG